MKKIYLLLMVCVFACAAWSCSDDDDKDTPISVSDLPQAANNFLSQFYPSIKITKVTKEVEHSNSEYDVRLANGQEVEFDAAGQWTDIDAPAGQVIPTGIVPEIEQYITANNFGTTGINEISRDVRGYEVELLNGIELRFLPDGTFAGYDN